MTPELESDVRQRARFDATRRRVFREIHESASRRRASMVIPFHALVLAVLVARGEPASRIALQVAAFVACHLAMRFGDRAAGRRATLAYVSAALAVLVSIANTGGVSSPLLVSVAPLLIGMSVNPNLDGRRRLFVFMFLTGFVLMAFGAHPAIGGAVHAWLEGPAWTVGQYVTLTLASICLAVIVIFKMGWGITAVYERVALELAARREELCDESEGRTRALEGIAARLAHEVKNPLAAIKGLSTHMARSADDAKVKERLSIVAAEAERLREIVDGFLSFSRGLDDLEIGPTRPYDIARELSLLLETRAADAGIGIDVRGSRELSVNADSKKLRQALLNLVLNAMHASAKGATVTLEVAKSCADGAAILRVMDRGDGMTPEILDRIRKPYFTTKEGGSGLGIAVARGIVEQHGGELRFESTSGRGTTVTVVLPACARTAQKKKTKLPDCRGVFGHDATPTRNDEVSPLVPVTAKSSEA